MNRGRARQLRRAVTGGVVVGALIAVGLVVGSTALSSPSTKYYTASITPKTVPGSSVQQFNLIIHNCGPGDPAPCKPSTQSLGSANITIPTGPGGFQLPITVIPGTLIASGGKTWTATPSGNVLQLRNPGPNNSNALAPGESVSLTFSVTTPSGCGTQSTVTTQTKQSNDFSGSGNDFTQQSSPQVVTVSPGALSKFEISSPTPPSPTAGSPFTVTVTAEDGCGSPVTNYSGTNFSIGGLDDSPNHTPATYGTTSPWSMGVATVSGILGYAASSTEHLVASDNSASVSSQGADFTIQPGSLTNLAFTSQPTETQKAEPNWINPAPAVTATDAWGNLISGATVALNLNPIAGSVGSFTAHSVTSKATVAGIATFGNLAVDNSGQYSLGASSPDGPGVATSDPFVIADQISPCNGSCSAAGSIKNNTSTGASVAGATTGALAVSVLPGTIAPAGVCGNPTFLGDGSMVNLIKSTTAGTDSINFTITWTLDKSIVQQVPNNGASQFNICLGAEDLKHPLGTAQGAIPWKQKDGSNAVEKDATTPNYPPGTKLFWGVLPDCPKQGTPPGPCVLSKHKDNAGDEVITFFKPAPWDANHLGF